MRKKVILFVGLLSLGTITAYALSNTFELDTTKLSYTTNSKKNDVVNSFNQNYNLTYAIEDENSKVVEEIEVLTKKTTYLLFGDFNNTNESSENYYKRKHDFYDLRYAPEIPRDDSTFNGFDTNSQEYKDDLVSGLAIPQIFNQAEELGLIYNSYGDIRITVGDELVISSITLPNVRIKVQSKENPMEYDYVETNFVMYYYYKKLNEEWKLYYLYGEDSANVGEYIDEVEQTEIKDTMAIAPSYESQLSTIYSFEKLENMTDDALNSIYNANVSSLVFLNSYYTNSVVASANGFFISNGLIVTTWNFLEKALIDGQYITVKDNNSNTYEMEGVVTANPETDVVVIKVKENNTSFVKLGDATSVSVEDPAIVLSSKLGVGTMAQTGIVISNGDYIQTSIPLSTSEEGSPLFNQNGEVIGINTSKSTSASVSIAINVNVLREIQEKFESINHDSIEALPFDKLKEEYYYVKYNEEKIENSIPADKWKRYSKIGNIEQTINLELIKASYKDGIVSLRYKNNISKYINSLQLAANFRENLENSGYKIVVNNTSKIIYENDDYQVIIMDEFDYLIIVMVKK